MKKTLIFNTEIFEAERVVKTDDAVIGYNGDNEIFSFRGVSEFSKFILQDENGVAIDFLPQPPTAEERLASLELAMLDFLLL